LDNSVTSIGAVKEDKEVYEDDGKIIEVVGD
jgi:hypothetical protein